ncbi:MAG TPA: V-type ATPase 116kDa subunit family protein [Candidatus Dormibacteraeota bacterium]|nr:V-type ATPase 116kDa subunit family protein [Candidatus Dormibacteraeota bacterium]
MPKRNFEEVMLYLREQNSVELLDVKEMIKGYGGGVVPTPISDRLYRLTTLESKINSVITALGITGTRTKPVSVEARTSDQHLDEVEKKVSELEQQVTSLTNEAQSLQTLVTYAERQLAVGIEEIMKIENVNTPEGRTKLQDIVTSIFQILKPPELKLAEPLEGVVEEKAAEEAVVKDISDKVAALLPSKRDRTAIADAITTSLGLKLRAVSRKNQLQYDADSRIETARARLKEINAKLSQISRENAEFLLVEREVIGAERSFEQGKGYAGKTESTSMIEGWMPTLRINRIKRDLNTICAGEVIVKDWTEKNAPTQLQNPKGPIMSIFEKLTIGFGVPKSDEVDPTVLWLITYPLFFGLMFGDVGNGVVVTIASSIIYYYKRKGLTIPDNAFGGLGGVFSMVIQGSPLLILSGLASLVVGFLYGTVFGNVEWFKMITGLPGPLWFEPFTNIRLMLRLSITIGVIHIISGMVLKIFDEAHVGEYRELISGPLVWLWFYVAFGITLLQYGLRFPNYLFNPANTTDIFLRMGIPLIAMLVLDFWTAGPMGLMDAFEHLLASLSHTISYVRILAMKLIEDVFFHLFLGVLVFFLAWGNLAGASVGWILYAALVVVLIMILETAFVFMQSLRLHWVEWFLKFFEGSGTAFRPYGIVRRYTQVKSGLRGAT